MVKYPRNKSATVWATLSHFCIHTQLRVASAGAGGGAGLCFGPVSLGTAEADTNICSELLYIYFISDLAALSSVLFRSDYPE